MCAFLSFFFIFKRSVLVWLKTIYSIYLSPFLKAKHPFSQAGPSMLQTCTPVSGFLLMILLYLWLGTYIVPLLCARSYAKTLTMELSHLISIKALCA